MDAAAAAAMMMRWSRAAARKDMARTTATTINYTRPDVC
jgi:hypothetical protein